jgi:hypothetical protein
VGELASGQDRENWAGMIQGRREEFAEPRIIRPFVDRMNQYQVLPPPGEDGYSVKWEDLFAMSEKEKVEVGGRRMTAGKDWASSPLLSSVISPETMMRVGMALNDDQIELNKQELEQHLKDEEAMREELGPEEPPQGGELEEGTEPGGEIPANPNQDGLAVQDNPCHNPSGPGGGQFCPGGGGGSGTGGGGNLTSREKESILAYQQSNYVEVNGLLRGNLHIPAGDKRELNNHVKNLDRAFQKMDKSDVNVYRGADADFSKGLFQKAGITKELKAAKVEGIKDYDKPPAGFSTWDKYFNTRLKGVTFQDKGFTSTSASRKIAMEFKSNRYEDPKNGVSSICNIKGRTKALDMNKITNERVFLHQKEMVLQRNNTYRIDGVKVKVDKSSNTSYLEFNVSII